MATTLSTTIIIKEIDSAYDSDTTTIQLQFSEDGIEANCLRMTGVNVAANPASPIDLFPNYPLDAGQRITMNYVAHYHHADNTNALRLLTWVADGSQVESHTKFGGGFSFDTSLTLDRAGNHPMTLDIFFRID